MKELIKNLSKIIPNNDIEKKTIGYAIEELKLQENEIKSLKLQIKLLENFIDNEIEYL